MKHNSSHQAACLGLVLVLVSLPATGAAAFARPAVPSRVFASRVIAGRADVNLAATRTAGAGTAPGCTARQLSVGGLGSSTATGTVIVTVRATNISAQRCALDGRPTVSFLGTTRATSTALATTVTRSGPGAAFEAPKRVTLVPAIAATAGFVITSRGKMVNTQHCQAVDALRVSLPGVAGGFGVEGFGGERPYQLCHGQGPGTSQASGFPVNVSSLISGAHLNGYAPAWPVCLATQVAVSLKAEAATMNSAIVTAVLTNRSTAPCTLDGYPAVALDNRKGATVARFAPGATTMTLFDPARPRPVTMPPGAHAQFQLSAAAYLAAGDGGKGAACPPSSELRLGLPQGGGSLTVHRGEVMCGPGGVGAITGD